MLRRLALCLLPVLGCSGVIEGPRSISTEEAEAVGVSGLRRLTRVELEATLGDLVGESQPLARTLLPPDPTDPFDNDYRLQLASTTLVDSLEELARQAAERTVADPARRAKVLPCMPTGAADATCFRLFVRTFGRQALRRPLTDDEVERFMPLHALGVEAGAFDTALTLGLRAFLQHPEFIYRVELGVPTAQAGVQQLSGYHRATRLSYLMVGSTPPDWLLDQAGAGELSSRDGVRGAAQRLLDDPRSRNQVERFHALWLGYHRLPHAAALTAAMQAESDALVERVVFDRSADYLALFTATDTFIDATLAQHYGLTGTGAQPAWTPYGSAPRKGLLSHGSVLSQGVKFADSSPTQRGIFIRNRLFCQEIPPPPAGVNVDEQPTSTSPCKKSRYSAHASVGGCKGCHDAIDPIGFGLERYDRQGRYRTTDDGLPQCAIDGEGTVDGTTFNGPTGLADALIASGQFEECITTQVFRYASGRREEARDLAFIRRVSKQFVAGDRRFLDLLVELVSDDAFAFRRDEEAL
ncbi:MAG: DUF1588 domain-containing protein [Myxococcus sp.]|nr:DUF1588 domain-containing protein [Myxococcus sp.]